MKERYYSLQVLRGVAACMVFYHHYMQLFYDFKYESIVGKFFSNYGSFGVDIFFVLSGFVMFFSAINPNANAPSFFTKRFFRVVPSYWFYTIVMMFFLKLFPIEFSYTDYDMKSLLLSLAFVPNLNPSGIGNFPLHTVGWTLNFEMMFYTILSLSILFSKSRSLIICSILILLFPIVWPAHFPFSQVLSSSKLYEFFSGIVIAAIITSNWFRIFSKHQVVLLFSSMAFGLLCLRYSYLHSFLKVVAASSIVFSTVLINQYLNKNNVVVEYFIKAGDYSYSTYLMHVFVIGIALHYFGNELELHEETVLIISLSIVLYILSRFSYFLLEQNRYLLLLMQYILKLANKANSLGQRN